MMDLLWIQYEKSVQRPINRIGEQPASDADFSHFSDRAAVSLE
jgi:hypothetical protein